MKKLLPMTLGLIIMLTACGSKAANVEPSPTPSPTASVAPASPTPPPSAVPTLGFTKEDYISAVDTYLKPQNYTTISSITPTMPGGDNEGITSYAYSMAPGFSLILSEDTASKNLTQIFITADKNLISSADMVGYGLTCFASIYQLEGDGGDSIISKLNMTSNTPDPVNLATGAYCSYSYMIDDPLTMFQVLPE